MTVQVQVFPKKIGLLLVMNDFIKFNIPPKEVYIRTLPEKLFCCTNFALHFLNVIWVSKVFYSYAYYTKKRFSFPY